MPQHNHNLDAWTPSHSFHTPADESARRTWAVVVLTLVTMVVEIAAGWWYQSMALLADGWHMSSHAVALTLTGLAYWLARHHATDPRYAFGTWKVEVLASFASAILLGLVGLSMVWESAWRLYQPKPIGFDQALLVAVVGLLVNLASVWLLHGPGDGHGHSHGGHDHDHDDHAGHHHNHGHGHDHAAHHHGHAHQDLNLRAAYLHVLADAATSVLAIGALLGGKYFGWNWLDPAIGAAGGVLVARWSWGLLKDASRVLLDREMDHPLVEQIRSLIEADGDSRVSDLHVWRVGRQHHAGVITVVTASPRDAAEYRQRLAGLPTLAHLTVEVHHCGCGPEAQ